MKRLLIISPYFPPDNTPDMQRVRMSLPYFKQYDWEAEVVTVDSIYADVVKDELLTETIPANIKVHRVKALNKATISKFGVGNIAYRSYTFYRKKVNELLKSKKFDLIYFSTTQFAICTLGAYWKKHFDVPYVIDMQDPWHSDYYQDKPKHQQPPKYWLSYRLNKYLEPIALKKADGLISVSDNYIFDLKSRYPEIKDIPAATITFGSFELDLGIASKNKNKFADLLEPGLKNIVYAGRGGLDMHSAIIPVFNALKQGLDKQPQLFKKLRFYFIGTSYAPTGQGQSSIIPLAKRLGVDDNVVEMTDRISYYHALALLQQADALFIPGSDDPKYTASKIYPYLMVQKPLLAIFNSKSSALEILGQCNAQYAYSFNNTPDLEQYVLNFLNIVLSGNTETPVYDQEFLKQYSSQNLTRLQADLFNRVIIQKSNATGNS